MHTLKMSLIAAVTTALCATAALSVAEAAGYRASKSASSEATVLKGKKKTYAKKRRGDRVAAYRKRGKKAKAAGAVKTAAVAKGSRQLRHLHVLEGWQVQ